MILQQHHVSNAIYSQMHTPKNFVNSLLLLCTIILKVKALSILFYNLTPEATFLLMNELINLFIYLN
jgi:hypothetical protein